MQNIIKINIFFILILSLNSCTTSRHNLPTNNESNKKLQQNEIVVAQKQPEITSFKKHPLAVSQYQKQTNRTGSNENHLKPPKKNGLSTKKNVEKKDLKAGVQNSEKIKLHLKTGTGFFISTNGLMLTNAHVVKNAKLIKAIVNKTEHNAVLVAKDDLLDVALLKINLKSKNIQLDTKKNQPLGSEVTVLGYPNISLQGINLKANFGFVNANSGIKDDERYIQISAPIQPGNSGSPLIDKHGNAIGIVTSTLNQSISLKSSGILPQNVNYAIKMHEVLASLSNHIKSLQEPEKSKVYEKVDIVKEFQSSVALLIVGFTEGTEPQSLPDFSAEKLKPGKKDIKKNVNQQNRESIEQSSLKKGKKDLSKTKNSSFEGEVFLYIEKPKE